MIACWNSSCEKRMDIEHPNLLEPGLDHDVANGFKTEKLCLPLCAFRYAKASLLLTGDGTQGVGFQHVPDWDVYKNDDWGRRREVLRRLVNSVGKWVTRRRAGHRLTAIQVLLTRNSSRANSAVVWVFHR